MGAPSGAAGRPLKGTAPSPSTTLVPCLLLRHGEVYLPSRNGPVPARAPGGGRWDPFDVVDRLAADYALIYLVDLDGVDSGEPQLDFLQELSRDATLWVDGGVRTSEQAIDVLVTGAQRAVLTSTALEGPRELARAWRLSTELVFEVELDASGLVANADWDFDDPLDLVNEVRGVGVDHIVLSPREVDPSWELVRAVAAGGPTWVDGSFSVDEIDRVRQAGAQGGIFHLDRLLGSPGGPPAIPAPFPTPRDDEA